MFRSDSALPDFKYCTPYSVYTYTGSLSVAEPETRPNRQRQLLPALTLAVLSDSTTKESVFLFHTHEIYTNRGDVCVFPRGLMGLDLLSKKTHHRD